MDEDEDAQTEQQLVLQEKARKEEELKVLEELLAEGYESPVHPRFTLARTPPSSFGPTPSSSLAPGDGGSQSAKRNLTSPEEVQDAVRRRVEARRRGNIAPPIGGILTQDRQAPPQGVTDEGSSADQSITRALLLPGLAVPALLRGGIVTLMLLQVLLLPSSQCLPFKRGNRNIEEHVADAKSSVKTPLPSLLKPLPKIDKVLQLTPVGCHFDENQIVTLNAENVQQVSRIARRAASRGRGLKRVASVCGAWRVACGVWRVASGVWRACRASDRLAPRALLALLLLVAGAAGAPRDDDGAGGAASGAGEGELESELEDEVDEAPFAVVVEHAGAGAAARAGVAAHGAELGHVRARRGRGRGRGGGGGGSRGVRRSVTRAGCAQVVVEHAGGWRCGGALVSLRTALSSPRARAGGGGAGPGAGGGGGRGCAERDAGWLCAGGGGGRAGGWRCGGALVSLRTALSSATWWWSTRALALRRRAGVAAHCAELGTCARAGGGRGAGAGGGGRPRVRRSVTRAGCAQVVWSTRAAGAAAARWCRCARRWLGTCRAAGAGPGRGRGGGAAAGWWWSTRAAGAAAGAVVSLRTALSSATCARGPGRGGAGGGGRGGRGVRAERDAGWLCAGGGGARGRLALRRRAGVAAHGAELGHVRARAGGAAGAGAVGALGGATPTADAARRVARVAFATDMEMQDSGSEALWREEGPWLGAALDLALLELEAPFGAAARAQPILMAAADDECAPPAGAAAPATWCARRPRRPSAPPCAWRCPRPRRPPSAPRARRTGAPSPTGCCASPARTSAR
ncbi:hypothetical protein MSG28_008366 [Choristoneura fumiferana]|uniref:Uncharacterized protein n=1 Tax=Choristoneura fumiferana TaxID=7141 RepID=A0ACC0J5W3_CHOFU|nr:hypothetical protein MSG28_008366 [Choristoneura fumiferana]